MKSNPKFLIHTENKGKIIIIDFHPKRVGSNVASACLWFTFYNPFKCSFTSPFFLIKNSIGLFTLHLLGLRINYESYCSYSFPYAKTLKGIFFRPATVKVKTFSENEWLCEKFFRIYLWLSRFGTRTTNNNRVYDHLGCIDTLGYRSDETRFTRSFSEELGCYYEIKLSKNAAIRYTNYEDKELSFVRYAESFSLA